MIHIGKDTMKAVMIRIIRPVVKAFYKMSKKLRRFIVKQGRRKMPSSACASQPRAAVPRVSSVSTRTKQTSVAKPASYLLSKLSRWTSWWKGWRKSWPIAAGAGAVVIAIAAVLIFALPHPISAVNPNGARASLNGAVVSQTPLATPQPTEMTPAAVPTSPPVPTANTPDTPVPTTEPEKEAPLQPGIHDPRVIELQSRLMELGYMDNDEPTDYYGGGTKYALELFQRKHGLQIDGLIGTNTETLLYSKDAQQYTVKLGDKGSDVKEIQQRLKELKYFSGSATGDFGEKTEAAVKSFQKRNGLSTDGNIGENTREVLFSEDAKEAKTGGTGGGSGGGGSGGGSGSGSGGGSKTGPVASADPDYGKADTLIEYAKTHLGKEYTRGGKGPDEFDCSGFVYYCLNKSGVKSIKYMTSGTWAKSNQPRVDKIGDLKKGDIICFKGHVGIYMGDGKMIHASSSADKVVIGNAFSSWSKRNFICGRRVL